MGTHKEGELDVVLVAGGVFSGTWYFKAIKVVMTMLYIIASYMIGRMVAMKAEKLHINRLTFSQDKPSLKCPFLAFSIYVSLPFQKMTNPKVLVLHRFTDPDDLNLVVTSQNVSFRASGSEAPTVVDCNGLGRFINVTNPDTMERTVLTLGIHAITFENCLSPGTTDGGVVLTWGIVSTTVTDCRFTSNSAMNGGVFAILYQNNPQPIRRPQLLISGDNGFSNNRATINGGAIYARYAQVTVTGTHFENNTAQSGGGIYWLSPFMLTVKNSAFRSNSALTTGPDGGNAIYATSSGSAEIDDVTFSNNRGQCT